VIRLPFVLVFSALLFGLTFGAVAISRQGRVLRLARP
jgi:hypothetical protein